MAATYQQIQAWLQAQLSKMATAVKNWANGKFATKSELGDYAKSADVVSNETYNADKATFETKENAAKTYQPIGEYPTKTEMSSAIEEAKEAIVGEDLKDSLETLEAIKSWKEQHGTEYTNLVTSVQGKLDKTTYEEDKATFLTKTEASNTYQPKGDYLEEDAIADCIKNSDLVDIDDAVFASWFAEA